MARIAVIGAGVVGVASAWMLCREGHMVTLIDRNPASGQGESFANGAQLSYSYCDALGSPAFLRHLLGIVADRDPAYRLRLQADPDFMIWGLRFLANCLSAPSLANTRYLLDLAQESHVLLREVVSATGSDFGHETAGKMILCPDDAAFQAAVPGLRMKQSLGLMLEALSRAEAEKIEPALAAYRGPIARVIYSPEDAVGLPDRFCQSLAAYLTRHHGLKLRLGNEVRRILSRKGAVTGVAFERDAPIECDAAVLATGHDQSLLPLRDRSPGALWPVQGYSLTRPATQYSMKTSITDLRRKTVFAPVAGLIRIAGLADLGPRRIRFDPDRFAVLCNTALEAFAGEAAGSPDQPPAVWTGARPCTPSSRPIIRASRLRGLYFNFGHGTLGWTLCLGSAARLCRIMGESGAITMASRQSEMSVP